MITSDEGTVAGVLVNLGLTTFFEFILICLPAMAQIPTATILGSVKDTSGAVIPGANVTATHVDTGQTRTTVTGSDGSYRLPALPIGNYELKVEHSGFQSAVRSGLTLTVTQEAVMNFTIEVGAVEQTVSVTAEAPMVNTTSGSLGGLVNNQSMVDLPLNGRNYMDLTLLQTGVMEHKDEGRVGAFVGKWISVNGATLHSNVIMLDGANLMSLYGTSSAAIGDTTLGVDGIQEYRVITNFFSAEYGQVMGSQTVMVSKGGTNGFHGDGFDFLRNSGLDARNFFDYKTAATGPDFRTPSYRRNQFGGSFGGPIKKDKTFFYGVYEGLRSYQGITTTDNVMPAGCHGGAGATIASTGCSLLSAGASATVAPVVAPLLALFPLPNLPNNEFSYTYKEPTIENYEQLRIDQNISSKDSLFGRVTFDRASQDRPQAYPFNSTAYASQNQFDTISESHIFSPTLLNTARSSFSRADFLDYATDTISGPQYQFVSGLNFGGLTIPGVTGPGSSFPGFYKQNIFSESDDMFYTRGRHSLKFGVLFNHYQQYGLSGAGYNGSATFTSYSNFLEGLPSTIAADAPGTKVDRTFHVNTLGVYLEDDLRVSSRLTLNLGLRYEFSTIPIEQFNEWGAIRNVLTDANMVLSPLFGRNPSLHDFSPRFGFAWDPLGDGKTAVRGGFGIMYDIASYQAADWVQAPGTNLPISAGYSAATTNPITNPLPFTLPLTFPATAVAGRAVRPVDYLLPQIHILDYNVTVERQLPGNMALTASYVGTRGLHLPNEMDENPTMPTILPDGQSYWSGNNAINPYRNPNWGSIDMFTAQSNSWYNSLQAVLLKRMTKGLQFQASYTWSKLLDEQDTILSAEGGGYQSDNADPLNLKYDKGPGAFDVPQSLRLNAIYHFSNLSSNGFASKLLNGWWTSGILSLQSGEPFTVVVGSNISQSKNENSAAAIDRPDLNPGRNNSNVTSGTSTGCPGVPAGTPLGTPTLFYDPCAFTLQPAGFLGTEGRNDFRGPNFQTLDYSLVKDTHLPKLGEAGMLEFRFEAFNLLNKANFSFPNRTVFSGTNGSTALATAGVITSTLAQAATGAGRQLQFALKLLF